MTIEERLSVTKDDFRPINQIFYGTVSGAAGKIAEYPLDTLMVRLQAQSVGNSTKGEHFDGIIDCVRQSLKRNGITGLYRGISIPLSACVIETSLSFLSYTYAQSLLINWNKKRISELGHDPEVIDNHLSLTELMLSGASSGIPVSIFITPFELLKCRVQVLQDFGVISKNSYTSQNSRRTTPIMMLRAALLADGLCSLYRGYTATLIREVVGGAIWFGVYEAVAQQFMRLRSKNKPSKDDLTLPELFISGACAGIVCSTFASPPDVIKSIQQTSLERISMYQVARRLLKYEGIKGLYRGLGVCLLRSSLSSGVTIGVYDFLRSRVNLGL